MFGVRALVGVKGAKPPEAKAVLYNLNLFFAISEAHLS